MLKKEKWVWVEGYKGTNSDMTCNGFQYELGKQHDMPEDEKIEICESGFHFCEKLKSVFGFYAVGEGHRYFKVRGLVRQSDLNEMKNMRANRSPSRYYDMLMRGYGTDKLVAKSIVFERELTIDEILEARLSNISDWTEEEKHLAITESVEYVYNKRREEREKREAEALVKLGYSEAFAFYIAKRGWCEEATAVGTQSDLSMDMKVLVILQQHLDD